MNKTIIQNQNPTNIINYFIVIVQIIQNKLLQNSNQPPQ